MLGIEEEERPEAGAPSRAIDLLRRIAGFFMLRRWPWPAWKIKGGGVLPIGSQTFWFQDLAQPQYAWWGHMVHRRAWEERMIQELSRALRPGDVFIDLGAFTGAYALLASRLAGPEGKVFAFEPDPTTRRLLERNIEANRASNVTVVPYAVGARAGNVRFVASGDSVGRVDVDGDVEVRQVSLDDYCRENDVRPTVMKVDIEGGEGSALPGSAVVRNLRELVVEVHEPQLREQEIDVEEFLHGLGAHELLEPRENENYGVLVKPSSSD